MNFSFKSKFFFAFTLVLLPFFILIAVYAYNINHMFSSVVRLRVASDQMHMIHGLQLSIAKAIMPPNDYIITGNSIYRDEFMAAAAELEAIFPRLEESVKEYSETFANLGEEDLLEEMETIAYAKKTWVNIKLHAMKIYTIKDPVGDEGAMKIMEEMDYRWSYPLVERLGAWAMEENKRYQSMVRSAHASRKQAILSIVVGSSLLLLLSIIISFYLSRVLTRPIKELEDGASALSGGDLDYRLNLDTGDEIGRLANSFNRMGERLKESYATLEVKVDERTNELELKTIELEKRKADMEQKAMELEMKKKELEQRVDELERFSRATIKREFRIKELKDELRKIKGIILT